MKVIISMQGDDLDALVDPRFGRARWLVVADPESGEWEAVDNGSNVDASGGAGVQASGLAVEHAAKAIITGNVGPNAHRVLAAAGVTVYQAGNGVTGRQALADLAAGKLPVVDEPTVAGSWS